MIPFPFDYNGKVYKNLTALCRGEGLPYARTAARLRAGRPLRDLFVKGHLGSPRPKVDMAGHPSIRAMADAAGVSYMCMYSRLHSGRTASEAMCRTVVRRPSSYEAVGIEIEFGGKVYPSLRKAAKAAGLPMDAVYQRWHRGVRGSELFAPLHGCVRETA